MLAAPLPVRRLFKRVAGAVDGGGAGEHQVFQLAPKRVGDRRLHGVDFRRQRAGFGDHVAGVVHDVGVVAQAAGHGVGSAAAVEDVGRRRCR